MAERKSKIELFVNRLDSVESVIPYEYSRFDFCAPPSDEKAPSENLGQVVLGERIAPSGYNITFKVESQCKTLCKKKYSSGDVDKMKKLDFLRNGIALNYQNHWILDNMPVASCYELADEEKKYCSTGFPIGCHVSDDGQVQDACVTSVSFLYCFLDIAWNMSSINVFGFLHRLKDHHCNGYLTDLALVKLVLKNFAKNI